MSATRLRPIAPGASSFTTLSPGRRYRLARDVEHVCHSKKISPERRVDRESPMINQSRAIGNAPPLRHLPSHFGPVGSRQALAGERQDGAVFPPQVTALQDREGARVRRELHRVRGAQAVDDRAQRREEREVVLFIGLVLAAQEGNEFFEFILGSATELEQREQVLFLVGYVERHLVFEVAENQRCILWRAIAGAVMSQKLECCANHALAVVLFEQELDGVSEPVDIDGAVLRLGRCRRGPHGPAFRSSVGATLAAARARPYRSE